MATSALLDSVRRPQPTVLVLGSHPKRDAGHSKLQSGAIRVMTYNVFFGRHWRQAEETIRSCPADVVCLQEVADESQPGPFVRPSQICAAFPGAWNFAPLWHIRRRLVGNMTMVHGGRIGPPRILRVASSEPYGTWSEVTWATSRFIIANIHLTYIPGPPLVSFPCTEHYRFREAVDLHRLIRRSTLPVVALGDYNTFFPSPAYWAAARGMTDCRRAVPGRHAATRPTYGLPFVIDHIFVTPRIEVLDYRVVVAPGSDHRPVIAELRIPPG